MTSKQTGWFNYEPIAGDNAALFNSTAVASGKPIYIVPNGNDMLMVAQQQIFTNRDVIIQGNGVRWIQGANIVMLDIRHGLGTNINILDVDDVEYDTTYGISSPGTSLVTRLTLAPADAATIVAQQYYRVASENVAPGGSSSENPRMAETVFVHAVDAANGYVYLRSTLYRSDLYTTTPTICRALGQDYKCRIEGIRINMTDAGEAANWTTGPFWVKGTFDAVIDFEAERVPAAGIYMIGNYRPRVRALIKKVTAVAATAASYGVWVTSGEAYGHYNIHAANCRHGFTDNWQGGNTGSVERHGPHMGGVVTGTAENCRGAGFDFHSSSVFCTMQDITISNSAFGPNAGLGVGFQLRGYKNRAINVTTFNCEVGGQIFANAGTQADDLILENHVSYDKKTSLYLTGLSTFSPKMSVIVRDCTYMPQSNRVIQVGESVGRFENVLVRPSGQSGGAIFKLDGNAIVRGNIKWIGDRVAGTWGLTLSNGSGNEQYVDVLTEDADALPGDAAYAATDISPNIITYATTLTADRAVTFTCTGRKRFTVKRTAGGAFNLNVTHAGGMLALAQNRAAVFEVHAGVVMLVSPTITIA